MASPKYSVVRNKSKIKVRKKDTGDLYAMKVMKKDNLNEKEKAQQILSEKKIIQKLQHPNIVQLKFAFQSVNMFY